MKNVKYHIAKFMSAIFNFIYAMGILVYIIQTKTDIISGCVY